MFRWRTGAVLRDRWSSDHVAVDGCDRSEEFAVADAGRRVVHERQAGRLQPARGLTLLGVAQVKMLDHVALVLAVALNEFLNEFISGY